MSDLKLATLLCLVLCLVACGGSGSGGTNSGAGTPGASVSSVTVTCTPNTVLSGGTLNCSAAVVGTGTFWSTVTWTATVGTIGPTGVYTAPSVTTNTTATITATSEYDSTKVGTAAVAVTVPSTISGIQISCPPVPITTGQQTQCTADVMGPVPEDQSVTWSGTIGYPHTVDCQCVSASGVVTGPVVNGMDQVSLLAVSTVDPTKVGYGSVYVYSPGTVTSVTPSCTRTAIYPGQDSLCTAVVTGTGGYSSAVSWSSPGGQSWGEVTPSGLFVSSPNGSPTSYTATVIASAVQNSSVSGSVTIAVNAITKTPNNVAPLIVDGGPQVATSPYINAAFASVTVCTPGTSNCQTVDHVLVDTGSVGLRLLAAPAGGELTLPLPTYTEQSTGDDLVECAPFVSGYLWGPVATADFFTLADGTGEEAYAIPVQVVGESGQPAVPSTCSSSGADLSTLQALGANGILGVGVFSVDCGIWCYGGWGTHYIYYYCYVGACSPSPGPEVQVVNPVAFLLADSYASLIQLPTPTAPGSLQGSLIFGMNTQPNNQLGSATQLQVDQNGSVTTSYQNVSYPGSFLDSGSNGFFFLNAQTLGTSMPACGDKPGFYCPATTQNFSLTNSDTTGKSAPASFSIANADQLFLNTGNYAIPTLGGNWPLAPLVFDFGLPFFYGRTVFTLSGQNELSAGGFAY